jgi:adenylate kinase
VSRLLKRGETSGRSDDTNEEIIRNRFAVYKKDTSQVAQHYKEEDKFEIVKGEGSVNDIFEALRQSIEEVVLTRENYDKQ